MAGEYGIVAEPSSIGTTTNKWEMGWEFTALENFSVSKLRAKLPQNQTVTANLWSSSGSLLGSVVIKAKAGEWVEESLPQKVELVSGSNYVVSCYNTESRYAGSSSAFSFNPKLSYVTGKYGSTKGVFPSNNEFGYIYPLVDIVFGGPEYVPNGTAEFMATRMSEVTEAVEPCIDWDEDVPEGTTLQVFSKINNGKYTKCEKGAPIPGINTGMDLSNLDLRIKVEMATSDPSITPSVSRISLYFQTEDDSKVISLRLGAGNVNSIQNAAGEVDIEYNGGVLSGSGGPVEPFVYSFIPSGLAPKNHPNGMSHIGIAVQATGKLMPIAYVDANWGEHIGIDVSASGTLTHIDDI